MQLWLAKKRYSGDAPFIYPSSIGGRLRTLTNAKHDNPFSVINKTTPQLLKQHKTPRPSSAVNYPLPFSAPKHILRPCHAQITPQLLHPSNNPTNCNPHRKLRRQKSQNPHPRRSMQIANHAL
ncbi:hypothetical protein B0T14DRAFT_521436 [Immersiella caudata]|uniref:Uncharacterized protein n=1 Tax=Immersiella caudata TaxID=314043 RepID=A0AA39WSB3_9PEZI|nr:hypothetical protein B0T14DRAFT_521436 [Immersiella caudata]